MKKRAKKPNWSELTDVSQKEQVEYVSSSNYEAGDVVNHSLFGLGYVQSKKSTKIEVLFQDKLRIMLHNFLY